MQAEQAQSLPQFVRWYGKDEPLPARVALRAGSLRLVWEEGDLRTVRSGGSEVLRRIYVAIRDRNWGTVPNQLTNVQMEVADDHFVITFDAANRQGEGEGRIDFTWRGRVEGTPEGVLTFAIDGEANTTFFKNRIGFCILHPAEAAGHDACIEHVDGSSEEAVLPLNIRPDQPLHPFAEMAALHHEAAPGLWATLRFEGDIFEMEDQRNWTDASYKTFSTPLRLPYPVELPAGTKVQQKLTLSVEDTRAPASAAGADVSEAETITFAVMEGAAPEPLPLLGLGMASHGEALNELQVARLHALALHHLRVDLWPGDESETARRLKAAAHAAGALGVGLEMALFLADDPASDLDTFVELFGRFMPPVASWIVYPANEIFWGGSARAAIVEAARPVLQALAPDAPFGSGTNYDLIFLSRNLPPVDKVDFLALAVQPQAHAFDNWSLTETTASQAYTVSTALAAAHGKPVHISPVTLKMRRNPYASVAEGPTPASHLPPQVDPRQMSLFGAGWTLASLKYLAESGAASITLYETTGWRGVMETRSGSPVPGKFASIAGGVYPLYHVLADVGDFVAAHGHILPSRSSNPLKVDGLVLQRDDLRVLLLANNTPTIQTVAIQGWAGPVRLRVLDDATVVTAMAAPEATRAASVDIVAGATLTVALPPYAVLRVAAPRG